MCQLFLCKSTYFNTIFDFFNKTPGHPKGGPGLENGNGSALMRRNERADLRKLLLGDIRTAQQRLKHRNDPGLAAVGENGPGIILFPGKRGLKEPAEGFPPLYEACFPDGFLGEQTIEQDVYGTVLPALVPGGGQQVRPSHGAPGVP